MATRLRPVYARASRTAAFTASEPFLANFTMSPPTICEQRFRRLELDDGGPAEVRSQWHLPRCRLDHRCEGMSQRHRTEAHAVLDELVAVGIPHTATQSTLQHRKGVSRILIVALGVRVSASRDHAGEAARSARASG